MLLKIIALLFLFGSGSGVKDSDFFVGTLQVELDTTQVNNWVKESLQDIYAGEFSEARTKIRQIEEWSLKLDFQEGIEKAGIRMADIFLYEQKYDSSEIVLKKLLEKYPKARNKASILNLLATAYRYKNNFEKAIETYQELLVTAEEKSDGRMFAAVHQNLGVAYMNMGKSVEGLNSYLLSIEYAEAEKDTNFLVIALNNLGDSYNTLGNYEEGEFYLKKSIRLAREKNMIPDLTKALTNLATLKSNTKDFDRSLELYEEALALSQKFRPDSPPVILLYNMGNLALKMEEPDKADNYFRESLKYSKELNISPGIYHNSGGLGNVAEQKGDYQNAIEWHEKAYDVALKLNSNPFIQDSRQKLYHLYKLGNSYAKALYYLEAYKALSDSLFDLEKEKELAELENEFELKRQSEINELLTEKQAHQEFRLKVQYILIIVSFIVIILVLYFLHSTRKVSKEKTDAYNQLTRQRKELNKLFAIIAHDLRTPLSSLQGILFLLKNDELSRDEVDSFASQIEDTVQNNIEVMEDLLSWAKGQMTGITFVKEEVNIFGLINTVISKQEYRFGLKELHIHNEIDQDLLIKSDGNAIKLIMRNLLSNSIKFTKSGGSIRFTSTEKGNRVQLCVSDTGIGMSKEIQDKVFSNNSITFSTDGTKGEKGTGFGLSLIKEFVKKLNGSITIESEEGKGTKFCIELDKME